MKKTVHSPRNSKVVNSQMNGDNLKKQQASVLQTPGSSGKKRQSTARDEEVLRKKRLLINTTSASTSGQYAKKPLQKASASKNQAKSDATLGVLQNPSLQSRMMRQTANSVPSQNPSVNKTGSSKDAQSNTIPKATHTTHHSLPQDGHIQNCRAYSSQVQDHNPGIPRSSHPNTPTRTTLAASKVVFMDPVNLELTIIGKPPCPSSPTSTNPEAKTVEDNVSNKLSDSYSHPFRIEHPAKKAKAPLKSREFFSMLPEMEILAHQQASYSQQNQEAERTAITASPFMYLGDAR